MMISGTTPIPLTCLLIGRTVKKDSKKSYYQIPHTHKDEQPVITDLLSQENQNCDNQHVQQLMARKNDTGRGHHNPSNPESTTSVDCKLDTGKDESFSSEAVKMETLQKSWGDPQHGGRIYQ